MMIGIFHSAQDSFAGQIRTLTLDAVVTLVPAPSNDSDNAPDWRGADRRPGLCPSPARQPAPVHVP